MNNKTFFSFVPNTITSLNVLSGCFSVVMAFEGSLMAAGALIVLASIFDFFDGMSARLLKAYSPMGKELDSLADVISFGLAPSVIVSQHIKNIIAIDAPLISMPIAAILLILFPYIITVFSALRLAKFNIDTRQSESFIGLPTPANAIFWAAVPYIVSFYDTTFFANIFNNLVILILLVIIFSGLLVAELPLFSLKVKNLKWTNNKTRYIFLTLSILFILLFRFSALSLIIILYIIMSVIENIACKKK